MADTDKLSKDFNKRFYAQNLSMEDYSDILYQQVYFHLYILKTSLKLEYAIRPFSSKFGVYGQTVSFVIQIFYVF